MGEAKRKGTFEERKAKAIERDGIECEERKKIEAEILANMTKEEKQKRKEREIATIEFIARCSALGIYPYNI